MKKKLLLLATLAICAATIVSGTLAYFTAEDRAHNVITTAGVDAEIEEWQKTDEGLVPYPKESVKVMPGTEVSKIVTIKNNEAESYIRAKYKVILSDENGRAMELSQETLSKIISFTMDSKNWIRKAGDNEWWYYAEAVPSGTSTEPLFTEVVFDGPNMTNEYQNCTVQIIVSAQAVQAANNGSNVTAVKGWPAE